LAKERAKQILKKKPEDFSLKFIKLEKSILKGKAPAVQETEMKELMQTSAEASTNGF